MHMHRPLQWDIFCHVVDNFGDIGVCWRLTRRLAALGDRVRLWVDDASALDFMAPEGFPHGVEVLAWHEPLPHETPGDVVVEAFACNPPEAFVARMAAVPRPPVWINLEYLSAEPFVERNHGLPSPHHSGLTKWFFYPGFTPHTGGLVREDHLPTRRARFDGAAWLAAQGVHRAPGERVVSLFCYEQPRLAAWWALLAERPTHLLLTPDQAQDQARSLAALPNLTLHALPWLSQDGFDHLLWASDLNLVRGEDSLVRALWAGKPMLWQIYPQDDGAHRAKLEAFADLYLAGAPPPLARDLRDALHHWAGTGQRLPALPDGDAWARHALAVQDRWEQLPELGTSLRQFALARLPDPVTK